MEWTEKEDKTLRQGLENGLSTRLIGESIGKSRNAVIGRIHRLNLVPQPPVVTSRPQRGRPRKNALTFNPQDIVENIMDYREMGLRWHEIALIYETTIPTVRAWAIHFGGYQPAKMRPFTPEEEEYIIDAWNKNVSVEEIADKINRSFGVIRQKIYRLQAKNKVGSREANKTRLLRQYGLQAITAGATASEALDNIAQAKLHAKEAAKKAANEAKKFFIMKAIKEMHEAIKSGEDRDVAIFNARAKGAHLEELAIEFDLTRERIRQICAKVATEIALKKLLGE